MFIQERTQSGSETIISGFPRGEFVSSRLAAIVAICHAGVVPPRLSAATTRHQKATQHRLRRKQ